MTEHAVDAPCVDEPAYEPNPRRWRILGVSLVIGFMALLDVSIVNVAIPSMREGLHTSAGTIQWVVSGYALAFGLTLVAGGRLGDAYGRRRLMLVGLGCFIVSSAAVGFAPNAALVVLARLAQGASAGLLTPQNSGLIQQLFRGRERGRAFGVFGLTVSVSSAVGPVLGGLIIAVAGEDDGWHWIFLINVPIGLVAMVAVLVMVPRRVSTGSTGGGVAADNRIDVPGALLLGATVLCLLYPVVRVAGGARLPLLLLVGVPVFGWAFVAW
ncbi:MFS transporter, partial [Nocardioides hankookensis]